MFLITAVQEFPHWGWECLLGQESQKCGVLSQRHRAAGWAAAEPHWLPGVQHKEGRRGRCQQQSTKPPCAPSQGIQWQQKGTPGRSWALRAEPAPREAVNAQGKHQKQQEDSTSIKHHGVSPPRTSHSTKTSLAGIYNFLSIFSTNLQRIFNISCWAFTNLFFFFFFPLNIKDKSQITLQGCQSSCLKIKSYPIPMWTRVFPETSVGTV